MSTMHRLLRLIGTAGDRRDQAAHPARARPELMANKPGQVWSWDITKLRGPDRGVYYDLYVILDIYSRYVVGWTVAAREDADIAKALIAGAAHVHGAPDSLHADRGTSMTSKPVAQLLVDLGVARSHSRPHVSNDPTVPDAPFTRWTGVLEDQQLALVSAGGVFRVDDDPMGANGPTQQESLSLIKEFLRSAPTLSVIPRDTPDDQLTARHPGYDARTAQRDPNTVFPLSVLRELETEGHVRLAEAHYSFTGATSKARLREQVAPQWARRFQAEGVDACLLVAT